MEWWLCWTDSKTCLKHRFTRVHIHKHKWCNLLTKSCCFLINLFFYLCLLDCASLWSLKDKRPTWCHLLFYFNSYVINMFQTLIYPSSGACDYSVDLPCWSYCSWFDVCWSFGVVGLEWYPCCRLKHNLQHGYHSNPTTLKLLQHTSNQEQYDQRGNSKEYSQAPDDGYINVQNMLST